MRVTDVISITELSRLLNKSRPTVYKYINDYENGDLSMVPELVKELFRLIIEEGISREEVESYCDDRFSNVSYSARQAIEYIKANQDNIDFVALDHYLKKVSRK